MSKTEPSFSPIASLAAQDLAGKAVLLEIGARLGALDRLISRGHASIAEVASDSGIDPSFLREFYDAMVQAGLVSAANGANSGEPSYAALPEMKKSINDTGYVLWSVMSCAPLIENAVSFARDQLSSVKNHVRQGDHVARTSRWMGEQDFYPQAENAIVSFKPKKIVDLGSGTCGLLIRCLNKLPEARGVGVDLNPQACEKARSTIRQAGLEERLSVVEAPIQRLTRDAALLEDADVIHGGFVLHDLMPADEAMLDRLLQTFRAAAPAARLVIVEAVPYAQNPGEKAFSSAYTFLHTHFMARRLLTEEEWAVKFTHAGYRAIDVARLGISGGRIFVASPAA